MPRLNLSNRNILPSLPEPLARNTTFSFIAGNVPDWLLNSSAPHRGALKQATVPDQPWFHLASTTQREEMKSTLAASWTARLAVDRVFGRLTEVEAFAHELLTAALKNRYDLTVDVRSTCLRLYRSVGLTGGFEVRTLSLLESCLHNFELKETRPEYYDPTSEFITSPSASGQFDVVPIKGKMSVAAFTALCRELNAGAAYQEYLEAFFDLANPVARAVLEMKVEANEKATLRLYSGLALIKGDIDHGAHRVLQDWAAGDRPLIWNRRAVHCHTLTMMGVELAGIVLVCADIEGSSTVVPVIAYIPHDPEHPLNKYASSTQFVVELTRQLRSPEYQRFFSRFVPYRHRGRFFFQLNNRLSKLQWHAPAPFQQLPAWRPEPVPKPDLQIGYARIQGDLWVHSFQQRLNTLFADARARAVPTDDEDAKSRWARWDSFLKVALTVLEVGAFVAAPFVPGLGELMLAYTAYQLLDETFEGIIEWAQGMRTEAFEHLLGVVESLIQLGTLVVGGQLVGSIMSPKASPLIGRMKIVDMADGRSRLWDSDLRRYSQSLNLGKSAGPDSLGIYRQADQQVLPLEGATFVIRPEPGSDNYRIQHPQRSDAYAPRLRHNGAGAWVHEAEQPQAWQGSRLMRRLGHQVDGFSEQSLEQIRVVSGESESALRRLHVTQQQPSAMLTATIERFSADQTRASVAEASKEQRTSLDAGRVKSQEVPVAAPSAESVLLRNEFPHLPEKLVRDVLVNVLPEEKRLASVQGQLSMRLKQAGREAMREWRITRAWEGLYLPASATLDSYRLALHSLERLPGWSPEVLIEIRNQSFDGLLIDSIGPTSAPIRKVLLRTVQNEFQPYDAQGNSLQGTGDFYNAVLQALPDAERDSLGLGIGEGQRLRSNLQQSTITRAQLRELLDDSPVRHTVQKVENPGYALINERLLGAGDEPSLEDRFKSLYPQATPDDFRGFVRASGTPADALRLIRERELAFRNLQKTLDDWVAIERGELSPRDQRYHKGRFAKMLKQCWQASESPQANGYTLNLDFHWSSDFLEHLPSLGVEFPHVSKLQFRHAELRSDITNFLSHFPELKALDLSENELIALPRLHGNLRALETLDLGSNQLTLTAESVAELAGLTHLQTLRLGTNPALTHAPDISAMAELQVLDLHDTGITEWPAGLFSLPRPRAFELDLQGNLIEQVLEVMAGSEQARLIARTRLSRDRLSDEGRELFHAYMRSVGYDPARSYPPKGEQTSVHWLEGVTGEPRQRKQTLWDELEHEPDSQGFFEVLEKVAESADYIAEEARPALTERVWRMLDAATMNTPLREELFRMASNPESCADAGAQIFNEMGIKVLIHEAWLAGSAEQVEFSLVRLAKGKSRLDMVNDIARANIQTRLEAGETFIALDEDGELTGSIDEVEVYLAFQTGLADRLELPWQSRGMLFRGIAGVSEVKIDEAYQTVLSLEAGEGVVNRMIEQKFWRKYLKGRYTQEVERNSREYSAKAAELFDMHLAGSISGKEYGVELVRLAEERKALLKTLTQGLLTKE
ncbi:hypothetical protein HU727_018560 [Pseudomonas sp. SWRI153]|uniref:RING-type E3 ubiquitin transferase n=1 Tax=Pseudomonas khorasanensis TaxID=2745508 RepID=A0A923F6G1_9PSED|nr:NEL-type E3 ubiquitin ligase domain-containing protein [Pseudomonas khorasanensis]MBV4487595.1 hypothetical protein [Pseudomonas khorasanensis]